MDKRLAVGDLRFGEGERKAAVPTVQEEAPGHYYGSTYLAHGEHPADSCRASHVNIDVCSFVYLFVCLYLLLDFFLRRTLTDTVFNLSFSHLSNGNNVHLMRCLRIK